MQIRPAIEMHSLIAVAILPFYGYEIPGGGGDRLRGFLLGNPISQIAVVEPQFS